MSTTNNKILSLDELAEKSGKFREQGKRVVLCHGTFDLMHAGHIRHLQSARQNGDVLFVTITADSYVNKGPDRPVFPQQLRAETLAALACVDHVAINHAPTSVNVISLVRPHFYAKGQEYQNAADDVTGNIVHEKGAVEAYGGKIVFTDDITFSSTSLLNEHFGVFPRETREYLQRFRRKYRENDVIRMLRSLVKLKALVVGDAIIDEYHYTSPMGLSAKGNHLAVRYQSMEQFAGGAMAVANHIGGMVENVTLVAGLGKEENYDAFVRSKLGANVRPVVFCRENAPTVVKRRYVDQDMNKLFEVYFFDEEPSFDELDKNVVPWLESRLPDYDLVIVPDFGNGFISPNMIDVLCRKARFLAVNTQINSGNRGYHVINRYPRADYVSLNEPEVRLATHNRHDPLEDVAKIVADRVKARHMAVTRGTKGAVLFDKKQDLFHEVPALSTKVLDRIGAGDTFLAFSSLCLGGGLSPDLAVFVGSAAAALDVQIVCNREPVSPSSLFKYIGTLLK